MIPNYEALSPLIDHLVHHGITPLFVGGCVRDALLGNESLDIDIELYGIDETQFLEEILKPFGKINKVGKSFGVYKLRYDQYTIDLSLPRTENKSAPGHQGFDVQTHNELDFVTASQRRDFTINAIGYNPITKTLLDPHGGIDDLRNKCLRCVSPHTFIEDPLRLLRAVQFVARFELSCDDTLLQLCKEMVADNALEELPKERIFEEFKKLFLLSSKPSIGMELLKAMGGLPFFTPLDQFEPTQQDSEKHPEGNVWTHTLMALDVMATLRTGESKKDLIRMFAILLHDCAKPSTTVIENGKIKAPHHAKLGAEIAKVFLEKITNEHSLKDDVIPLIFYHGQVRKLYKTSASDAEILHLSVHVCLEELLLVAHADFFGRGFKEIPPPHFEAGEWLREKASKLGVLSRAPIPLMQGKDLIAIGLCPSTAFKNILDAAYEAQLNGLFLSKYEAIQWTKNT